MTTVGRTDLGWGMPFPEDRDRRRIDPDTLEEVVGETPLDRRRRAERAAEADEAENRHLEQIDKLPPLTARPSR